MSKIYDLPLTYRILRSAVLRAFRFYYGEIIVTGIENIPTNNGGYIFAPNHRNALMDALAVAYITPKNISTSFLARSDIFKNKNVAKFMRFVKIMPAFRMRDGFDNLGKNNDVFEECAELLEANHALCIMPEGNQEIDHNVRPLVKGIFRVAFSAQLQNNGKNPIQIVPVGIDYGDIFNFGKHLIINIGKPINVSDYSQSYSENPPKATNDIKVELKKRLEKLILHIDSDKNYDTILSTIYYCQLNLLKDNNLEASTLAKYQTRKLIADKLCEIEKTNPETIEKLSKLTANYKAKLEEHRIKDRNVTNERLIKPILLKILFLTTTFPLFSVGLLTNFLAFFVPVWIRKMLNVEFEGFFSSIQFVIGILTFPVFYTLQVVLICSLFSISFYYFPLFILLFLLIGNVAFKWYKVFKSTNASIRYMLLSENERNKLIKLQNEILNLVK